MHTPNTARQEQKSLTGHLLLALNTAEGFLQIAAGRMPVNSPCHLVPSEDTAKSESLSSACHSAALRDHLQQYPVYPAGTELLCAQQWHILSQGTELLAPALDEIVKRLKVTISDITHLACVTGPGSFTGIRLATGTAAGLSRATGALQGGVPYLPLLAINAIRLAPWLFSQTEQAGFHAPLLWVMTHARRDLVHMQGFAVVPHARQTDSTTPVSAQQNCSITRASEVLVLSSTEAAVTIITSQQPAILLGSGVQKNAQALTALFAESGVPAPLMLPSTFSVPLASTLLDVSATAPFTTSDLAPTHIRPCDAEENLDHIAGLLHLEPKKAREALFAQMHRGLQTEE